MQRKISNTKKIWSGVYIQNRQKKLHSIPIINKMKSNVLYSIPCGCVLALLFTIATSLLYHDATYAWVIGCTGTVGPELDSGSITAISGGTSTPASASLALSNPNLSSPAITPGSVATVSTDVTVNVSNAGSYSLTLKMNSDKLTSGNTTINAGNVVTDNTWGYRWDKDASYTAPSTIAKTLTVPALSNSATSFTKNLTFGVKFASSADSGHYRGSGTISLIATPKAATYTLANLTQMQQLSLAPEACANTPYLNGQNYSAEYTLTDVRDNSTYTVRKFSDGKCWMTQNLRLSARTEGCIKDRKLISATSDINEDWILPTSSTSGFSDSETANMHYDSNKNTSYYSWCAATASSCSEGGSPISSGNADYSICPKGWKLPSGGSGGEFEAFANAEGIANSSAGSTKIQNSPYNFTYVGFVTSASTSTLSNSEGFWWSRTAEDSKRAKSLYIASNTVRPTSSSQRENGFAIRCVAE